MKSLTIYQEVGILAASAQHVPGSRDEASGPVRHQYHHAHFRGCCDPKLSRLFAGPNGPEVFASQPPGPTLSISAFHCSPPTL